MTLRPEVPTRTFQNILVSICGPIHIHIDKCPDTKQYDSEALVILVLWGMWSTPSLPSLSGSLRLEEVAPDRVLSMDQIELFDI